MREIRIDGNVAYIPLTQGYEAIIDASDVEGVADALWFASVSRKKDGSIRTVYAARHFGPRSNVKTIPLHREIMNAPDGLEVDHIDGDGLNNRRSNLRLATRAENVRNMRLPSHNTSGHKGVRWKASERRWQAFIKVDGKVKWLGSHRCKTSAVLAYAKASREFHKEFGRP
jgi:hypothetical protein